MERDYDINKTCVIFVTHFMWPLNTIRTDAYSNTVHSDDWLSDNERKNRSVTNVLIVEPANESPEYVKIMRLLPQFVLDFISLELYLCHREFGWKATTTTEIAKRNSSPVYKWIGFSFCEILFCVVNFSIIRIAASNME